jgi:hypothetical protein
MEIPGAGVRVSGCKQEVYAMLPIGTLVANGGMRNGIKQSERKENGL